MLEIRLVYADEPSIHYDFEAPFFIARFSDIYTVYSFLVCHFPRSFHNLAGMERSSQDHLPQPRVAIELKLYIKNLKMFSKLSTNHGMKIIIHGRSEIKFYIYGHFRAQKSRKWKWYDTMDLIEYSFYSFCSSLGENTQLI